MIVSHGVLAGHVMPSASRVPDSGSTTSSSGAASVISSRTRVTMGVPAATPKMRGR